MKLIISEQVLLQEIDDEVVLLDIESGRYFSLEAVGAQAWKYLVELGDTDEVLTRLLKDYAVDQETLTQDLNELYESLIEAGLVECQG